jgi:DNA-binding NtrC family response regulator
METAMRPLVVVADDEAVNRRLLHALLEAEGMQVVLADDGPSALAAVERHPPAVAIVDLRMPGWDGLETLQRIKAVAPLVPVILLTAQGDVPTAVKAVKLGAYDFVQRPLSNDKLLTVVRHAIEGSALAAEVGRLRRQIDVGLSLSLLMGASPLMQALVDRVRQVAESTFTVVLEGESGSGKEVVARAIHQESGRRRARFVPLDCGAIPETLVEAELFGHEKGAFSGADRRREGHFQFANGGTLFLDEVDHLPLTVQAKLLRVLQERQVMPLGSSRHVPVDVRIIAASNRPLRAEADAGRFRPDLYYRLAEFAIVVPPLRERREDIPRLAQRFVEEAALELGRPAVDLSDEAVALLTAHAWPGNVRELRNIVRQAVLQSRDMVSTAIIRDLLSATASPAPAPETSQRSLKDVADAAAEAAERGAIVAAVRACGGNKTRAARLLQTDFKTLHLKMKRYGLQVQGADTTDTR